MGSQRVGHLLQIDPSRDWKNHGTSNSCLVVYALLCGWGVGEISGGKTVLLAAPVKPQLHVTVYGSFHLDCGFSHLTFSGQWDTWIQTEVWQCLFTGACPRTQSPSKGIWALLLEAATYLVLDSL